MIKLEVADVYGFEAAIRGARNPMNSWDLSDSYWEYQDDVTSEENTTYINRLQTEYVVGPKDLKLLNLLARSGPDHGKYLRMINVTVDITAPWYWWKEFDTYKVGTVANSCSTMHKLTYKPFEISDFSCEHLEGHGQAGLELIVTWLNSFRDLYIKTKDKRWWWQIIQILPSSYNQRRTVQLNYAVLRAIYHARKNHKLDEWHTFCKWIESLPYSEVITSA